jgi:exonuclease SbcC
MQAFGPYTGRETVDFREAVEAGLFGIYGQTGSGKSTIFSAMTFALFGQAAKAEQEASTLRADGAEADVPTEVEFVFDIADRRYVVRRRPEQRRPKQRGAGETADAHEAWLFDATGMALDEIREDNPGRIIQEKKVGAVGHAIEDILGYGAHQFRQIVLLPQGRFEAFLAADTKARLGILRDLFDVSLYRKLAAKLKTDAEAAERQFRSDHEVFVRRLSAEGFESLEQLQSGIATGDEAHKALQLVENQRREERKQAQTSLENTRIVDGLFARAARTQVELTALQKRLEEFDELERGMRAAEQAQRLLDVEDQVVRASEEQQEAQDEHAKAVLKVEDANQNAKRAASALAIEEAGASEILALQREIDALKRNCLTLEKAAGVRTSVQEASQQLDLSHEAAVEAEAKLSDLERGRDELIYGLKAERNVESERTAFRRTISELEEVIKLSNAFEVAEREVQAALARSEKRQETYETAVGDANAAATAHQRAEDALSLAQAFHLAGKLHVGEPCPVCGSLEHPNMASNNSEHAGLDATFRETKAAWERALTTKHDAQSQVAVALEVVKERRARLAEMAHPAGDIEVLKVDREIAVTALQSLGVAIDVPASELRLEALGAEIANSQISCKALRDKAQLVEGQLTSVRAKLEAMLDDVPENLRDAASLHRIVQDREEEMRVREERRLNATELAARTREGALAASKDVEALSRTLSDRHKRLAHLVAEFASRLEQAQLTDGEFQALKPKIASIDEDRANVDSYRLALHAATGNARSAAEAIIGLELPQLPPLEDALHVAEIALQSAQEARAAAGAKLEQMHKLFSDLSETVIRLEKLQKESGPLRELSGLLNSQNALNLDIETYAIGAMFDQVLVAANLRLQPMSSGRYSLERAVEGAGRGRRGLGILVHDIYTGKSRSTSTLSGGEGFIAALALALGLADVVESVSGKVRLDTIFIDEGFGSLDSENGAGTLDQVLQALGALAKQKRAVGVISHVQIVQEAIPNGFYIRKDLSGSYIEPKGVM